MKSKKVIIAWVLAVAAWGARVFTEMNRQQIIIEKGISGFRSQAGTATVVAGIFTAVAAILLIADAAAAAARNRALERQAETEADAEERAARERTDHRPRPSLSVDGELDPAEIRRILLENSEGEWSRYRGNISLCVGVLDQMQESMGRLDTLLDMNGAESLRDTKDVLRQAQQYICRNMRKVINYLYAVDIDSREAEAGIRQRFSDCISDSTRMVDKVNDFLISLSDYLNSQGEDKGAVDMLDIYKNTILESMQDTF